ncbi:IS66-like element accessory protein TnpA [Niveispirillum cyanobacteriorum]|uniref:IS66-like element accessory protein TnpA n=1 Tax=Niveispirillum cyanobacteriorum TaxID=1612173 RepID=UPI001B3BA2C6|nr:transposase [Niveispirillum cyanobacteriorum]
MITGQRRRRNWTAAEKAVIVSESAEAGANISDAARRHGVNRALLSVWRRQAGLAEISGSGQFVPVTSEATTPCAGRTVEPWAVDVDLRAGRVRFSGAVDPIVVRAVLTALGGQF